MTLKLETLDIVSKAAGFLQTSDDGVRRLLGAFYDIWPEQVPDSWDTVESSLQEAGATVENIGAFAAFLKTLTEDATVGEHPRVVLDDAAMRGAFQRVPEPEREYVAPGSLIFHVAGRYFRGEGHEVWQAADEFGIYFHDHVQNYDSQGNVLLDEDDEEEPEDSAEQGATPDYDALCAQVVLHYAIPTLTYLVSSRLDLAASRAQEELIASLSSVLAHHLSGRDVPERADELVAALTREVERHVQANPEPAAQFHTAFDASGPVAAGQWLDYRFDEDSPRIDEVLAALPRPKAEEEASPALAHDGADLDGALLEQDPYDALLARILEEVPQAAGMPPRELHGLVALTLSE